MASTHIATCALLGYLTGKRVGTRYFYAAEEAIKNQHEPHFRWRNQDCEREAVAALRAASGEEL